MLNQQFAADEAKASANSSTVLPIGELEISTNILAVFLLE
jgi:hypothetical protein